MVKNLFGLIGYPLSHSFSKKYFTAKFKREEIPDCLYDLFPLDNIEEIEELITNHPNLVGLNVTIPYKQAVLPFLDKLDVSAAAVGAVNTIKLENGRRVGYNTDVYGFQTSLEALINEKYEPNTSLKGLILGTGGASKAVAFVFNQLDIDYQYVSRNPKPNQLAYTDLNPIIIEEHLVIVNTTPLGMSPSINTCPDLPYELITAQHLLYDLVYNPEVTLFLKKGLLKGATTKNGLDMLHGQAEKSWAIWRGL